jgi:capsular exopolysaccharide synthesis family protein
LSKEDNPQVLEMRRELMRTQSLLDQLLKESKGDNPMIQGTREKIDSLKKQLAFEEQSRSGDGSALGPDFQQASQELKELDLKIKSLEQRRDDLAAGRLLPRNLSDQELAAVERDRKTNEDIYQALRGRLENAQISQQMDNLGHSRRLEVIDPARLPQEPTAPDPMKMWVIGFGLAVIVGGGAVAVREALDTSFRHAADAAEFLGGASLGVVPSLSENVSGAGPSVAVVRRPDSSAAEAVRLLRTALLSTPDAPSKVILLAGTAPGDGASTLSANLAASFAKELSKKVLLIDADLARGRAAALFGQRSEGGLSEFLSDGAAAAPRKTDVEGLSLLPSGRPTEAPSRFFGLARMTDLMARLRSEYDVILIDAPPASGSADVPVLLDHADRAVLVVRIGKTPRGDARRAVSVLEASPKARMAGYVLMEGSSS